MTWSGGAFGDTGTCVLAPNADVMTLDGTNTWVLRDPDSSRSVVVDPGPSIDVHLDAIDAVAGDVSTESDRVLWSPVREAIRMVDDGEMFMLPPTYCTCLELFDHETTAAALDAAAGRDLTPVKPTAVREGDGVYLTIPERLTRLGQEVAARMRP